MIFVTMCLFVLFMILFHLKDKKSLSTSIMFSALLTPAWLLVGKVYEAVTYALVVII